MCLSPRSIRTSSFSTLDPKRAYCQCLQTSTKKTQTLVDNLRRTVRWLLHFGNTPPLTHRDWGIVSTTYVLVSMRTLTMFRTYFHREPAMAAVTGLGPTAATKPPKTTAIRYRLTGHTSPWCEKTPQTDGLLVLPINRTWSQKTISIHTDHSITEINGAYFSKRRPLDPSPSSRKISRRSHRPGHPHQSGAIFQWISVDHD